MSEEKVNLGFSYQASPNGEVKVFRHSKFVTMLRGETAKSFLTSITGVSEPQAQQIMARVTGNYRRGNERNARNHPRNA